MIKKYYWAMAVIAAFVAGTILSGSTAEAKPGDEDGDAGLVDAVNRIQKRGEFNGRPNYDLLLENITVSIPCSTILHSSSVILTSFQSGLAKSM